MKLLPPSPCIGICSTVYGDDICRGCKREYREVIQWNTFSPDHQQAILDRLEKQMAAVLPEFLIITDETLLKTKFAQAALRPAIHNNIWCLAHELLRLKADTMMHLQDYGLQARQQYQQFSPNELFTVIDERLYESAQ